MTISEDGGILFCNNSFAELMGLSLEKTVGTSIEIFLQPNKVDEFREMLKQSTARPVRNEMMFRARDGTSIPMQLSISYLPLKGAATYCMILANLTERVRAEEALQSAYDTTKQQVIERTRELSESETRYRSIYEKSLDAILLMKPDGTILSANPAAQRMFRMTEVDLQEAGWEGIGSVDDRKDFTLIEGGNGRIVSSEFTFRKKNNFTFEGEVTSSPYSDADGIEKTITIIRDITERKRAQENLSRSNAELQQFAYIASHDLQEPLRMVISYLSLLEKRYKDQLDDRANEYIMNAVGGAIRMKALINDLLEYSRIETQTIEFNSVDMNEVVVKTLALLEVQIKENRALVTVDRLPTIRVDRTQMIQVFQNIIGNAIKYRSKEDPRIHISAQERGTKWVFAVQDNGIGLNMAYADRIMTMFQRLHTREEYPGTGVGLAICKRIIERYGGYIWVESEEGKGSDLLL